MNTPLKSFRESNGLTQLQLAKILGVSQPLIAHIESGRRHITPENAIEWDQATNGKLSREMLRPDIFLPKESQSLSHAGS